MRTETEPEPVVDATIVGGTGEAIAGPAPRSVWLRTGVGSFTARMALIVRVDGGADIVVAPNGEQAIEGEIRDGYWFGPRIVLNPDCRGEPGHVVAASLVNAAGVEVARQRLEVPTPLAYCAELAVDLDVGFPVTAASGPMP